MVEVDLSQLPFTLMDEAGRDHVRRGKDIAYFERDEIILEMGQAGESVFLIHKAGSPSLIPPCLLLVRALATTPQAICLAPSVSSTAKAATASKLNKSACAM